MKRLGRMLQASEFGTKNVDPMIRVRDADPTMAGVPFRRCRTLPYVDRITGEFR